MGRSLFENIYRLRAIIESTIDGIITISSRGIIETINSSGASLFGYSKDELIGNNVSMLMPNPHNSKHDNYISRYEETGNAKIIGIGREVLGKKKDGTLFPVRLAVNEVKLADRTIYAGIIHDLTEINKVKEDLIQANLLLEEKVEARTRELESAVNRLLSANKKLAKREQEVQIALEKERELSELKSRFVSMASHEFKTPLSTIKSSAILISKYTTTEKNDNRLKHIERIKSAVDNLTGILNDFLSLSKLEEGRQDLNIQKTDLGKVCEVVKEDVKTILKPGQEIILHCVNIEQDVFTDQRILKNILFNLLSNAIKYSDPGKNINCEMEVFNSHFRISIQDEGIGIPEKEQKYLFTRFFRASNADSIQGTGLGLNIVKSYVKMLKGDINFESKENKGSTFTLKIPRIR